MLALPLDPLAADGAAPGGRQIEYKFWVEYEVDDEDEAEEEDERQGQSGAKAGFLEEQGFGALSSGNSTRRSRRLKAVCRPAPSDPVIRTAAPVFASEDAENGGQINSSSSTTACWTESHANNKRMLAPNKLFVLPSGTTKPEDEVLATGDFGGWHAAIALSWNSRARRHEAAASLPAGSALSYRFLVNGRPVLAPGGLLPVAPAPPPAPAGRLAHRDASLPPPRAFTLFYATGWSSATLVYRFRLPHLAAGGGDGAALVPVTPWQQLAMDVAPSRDAPHGGRWMVATVEPPPALRRDPWLLERRAADEEEGRAGGGFGGGGNGSSLVVLGGGDGSQSSSSTANRVAALAAAPSPPCELEFFVRGPPIAPPPPSGDGASASASAADSNAALALPCPRHPEEDRPQGGGQGRDGQEGHRQATASSGGTYILPAPMAWKLSRGRVRKFPRALRPPCMLVSDLDHTLFAEGEEAASALGRFTHYWESEAALARSVLVYNTGRSLGQFVSLVNSQQGRLALPDVLVTAVGTKVFHLKAEARASVAAGGGGGGWGGNGGGNDYGSSSSSSGFGARPQVTEADWQEDLAWARRLDRGWDLSAARDAAEATIRAARDKFSGDGGNGENVVNWLDDGSEHPHRVAVSSHVRATPFIVSTLRAGMAARGVQARVIVSGAGEWRYVDAVARRAGKAAALEHVRRLYGVPPERTMAAGDSCNDVLMLAAAADGGMGEALAGALAGAAAAAAEVAASGGGGESGGDQSGAAAAAAAGMMMMRDYWAGGGSATFMDEASDPESLGGWRGSGGDSTSDEDAGGAGASSAAANDSDGDGGRAPRVRAVVVGNAQRELVEWYDALRGDTGAGSIVLATGRLADGVLEGLMRHGLY